MSILNHPLFVRQSVHEVFEVALGRGVVHAVLPGIIAATRAWFGTFALLAVVITKFERIEAVRAIVHVRLLRNFDLAAWHFERLRFP